MKNKMPGRLPTARLKEVQSDSRASDSSLVPLSAQELVSQLDRLLGLAAEIPLVGKSGCAILDVFERFADVREDVRERARAQLTAKPGSIRHWRAETVIRRQLKARDGAELLEALVESYPDLSAEQLLEACTPAIGKLEAIGLTLEPELIAHSEVIRLIREKEDQSR